MQIVRQLLSDPHVTPDRLHVLGHLVGAVTTLRGLPMDPGVAIIGGYPPGQTLKPAELNPVVGWYIAFRDAQMTDHGALGIEVAVVDSHLVVTVRGELDLATVPDFEAAIATAVSGSPGADVIVECSALEFVDSAGLAAWVRVGQETGRELGLAGAGPRITRLLELSGLEEAIPVFEDVETAISRLGRS